MDPFVVFLVVGLTIVSVISAAALGERSLVSEDGNRTVVVYGRLIRSATVAGSMLLVASSIYAAQKPNVEQFDAVFFVISAVVIAAYLLCEVIRTRYEYDNDSVLATSALRRERAISWEDVMDISYSYWTLQYVLHLRSGTTLRVSEYLTGSDALMDFARKWKDFNNEASR